MVRQCSHCVVANDQCKVDMYVPQVKMLTFQQLANVIGGEETLVAGIMLSLEGDIEGSMLFMLGSEDAHRLVEQLLGMKPQADDTFSEMEMSALMELGNIITVLTYRRFLK